jgi:hypothetical protein
MSGASADSKVVQGVGIIDPAVFAVAMASVVPAFGVSIQLLAMAVSEEMAEWIRRNV